MNKFLKATVVVVLAAGTIATARAMASPIFGAASPTEREQRSVSGRVVDNGGNAVADAVVYLKNTNTLSVKTFIAGADGGFQFNALLPNVDYEVYAESNGRRSDTKVLSGFDSKAKLNVTLKIKDK
jgi:hypothetical protein